MGTVRWTWWPSVVVVLGACPWRSLFNSVRCLRWDAGRTKNVSAKARKLRRGSGDRAKLNILWASVFDENKKDRRIRPGVVISHWIGPYPTNNVFPIPVLYAHSETRTQSLLERPVWHADSLRSKVSFLKNWRQKKDSTRESTLPCLPCAKEQTLCLCHVSWPKIFSRAGFLK